MQKVLRADDHIMDAHLTLGNWLAKSNRPEEAIVSFRRALELKPDDEVALLNLANAYRNRGQPDDALAALDIFKGALKVNPRNPQAWFQLATLYLDLGKRADAEATFREALKSNPSQGAAYNALGAIEFERGRMEPAEQMVRKGLELEPDLRTGHFNLGRVLEARGQLDAAEREYRAELATYADHGRARFNLAQLRRERGDRASYLAGLREAVEKAPTFGPSYFFLAREELAAGRFDSAADLARRGLAADPSSALSALGHYVLADVYNHRGQGAEAQREVTAARRLEAAGGSRSASEL